MKRNVRQLIADQYRGRDAPVKVAAAESILNAAGGNLAVARAQIRERNEFGRTLAQELQGARNKLTRRVNRTIDSGIRAGRTRRQIADDVSDIVARNYETKRVIAWHAARAANRAEFQKMRDRGVIFIVIQPSALHPQVDMCDEHFGRHHAGYPLPPYHPFCTCIVVEP